RGRTFTLHIGKPIPWQTFDRTKNHREWAHRMQRLVAGLPEIAEPPAQIMPEDPTRFVIG
ncbi:MAG: hypothetical protein LBR86_02545, partial [Tannerella sp.]|nr:hypothetical protein [Tannerella sp.]